MSADRPHRHALLAHPHAAAPPAAVAVCVMRADQGGLRLIYQVEADLAGFVIPPPRVAARSDGLWRHTCGEAFVQAPPASGYREFNFSPAGRWQAYDFEAYRQGGRTASCPAPRVHGCRAAGRLTLDVLLPARALPPGPGLRLGLALVLEHAAGGLSYWALHHPPGRPDFHHPDSFSLTLE